MNCFSEIVDLGTESIEFGFRSYLFLTNPLNFYDSQQDCLARNSYLAMTFVSRVEHDFDNHLHSNDLDFDLKELKIWRF